MRRMSSTVVGGILLLVSAAVPSAAMSAHAALGAGMSVSVNRGQPPVIGNPAPHGPVFTAHPALRKTPVAVPDSRKQCINRRYAQLRILGHDMDLAWAEANLIC
jgi:hypothetical protein